MYTIISYIFPSSAMHLEYEASRLTREEGYRKFGGYLPVRLPVRDMSTNMRVTAKQRRHNGGRLYDIYSSKEIYCDYDLYKM
ncbi:MAG: hypothetical protein GX235_10390 [Clostridiales bacterium]|nr:hypothetical protein [Clostridiales bacterium]